MVQEGGDTGHQVVDEREKLIADAIATRTAKPVTDEELSAAIHEVLAYNYEDEHADFCGFDDLDVKDHVISSLITLMAWKEQHGGK